MCIDLYLSCLCLKLCMGNCIVTGVQFRMKLLSLFCIVFGLVLYFGLSQCLVIRLYLSCEENDFKHVNFLSIYQNLSVTDVHRN